MAPNNQVAAQQRMNLGRNMQLGLGQGPRVGLNPQQTQQQYGLANFAQRAQHQQQQQGPAPQAQLGPLAPSQLRDLGQQGASGSVNGVGGTGYSSLALMHQQHQQQQQQQQQQRGVPGPNAVNRGLGARLGMLGSASGAAGAGAAPGAGGYSAPSGDLLSMLSKAAASQGPAGGLGLGLGAPQMEAAGDSPGAASRAQALNASSSDFPSLTAAGGGRSAFGDGVLAAQSQEDEFPALSGPGGGPAGPSSAGQAPQQGAPPPSAPQQDEQALISARYGLLGLANIIRTPEAESSALVLGFDLTSLGLSLNQAEPIWKDFTSPFAEGPTPAQQEFEVRPEGVELPAFV